MAYSFRNFCIYLECWLVFKLITGVLLLSEMTGMLLYFWSQPKDIAPESVGGWMLIQLSLEDMPGRWVTHAICYCQASNLPDLHLSQVFQVIPLPAHSKSFTLLPSLFLPWYHTSYTHAHTQSQCCAFLS